MKRLPFVVTILVIFWGLTILLWAVKTDTTDVRSRADLSATPTATPSATPTLTSTPTLPITPTPTNSPPKCSGLSVSPGSGVKPLTVTFSCAGFDPDNDITAAEFGFGGSEKRVVEKGTGQFGAITTTFTYTKAGSYNTTCRVRDNNQAFSNYPDYCTYTVVVTENSLTPTPQRTPIPTPTNTESISTEPLLFLGGQPTVTTTPTAVPAPSPTLTLLPKKEGWFTSEKMAQLVMMIIVSGITVIVALLLHGFFDKR